MRGKISNRQYYKFCGRNGWLKSLVREASYGFRTRFVQLGRARDRSGDAFANIFRADVPFEFGLLHQLSGLLARAT